MPILESDFANRSAAQRRALKLEYFIPEIKSRLPFQWTYQHPTRGNIGIRVNRIGYRNDAIRFDIDAVLTDSRKKLRIANPIYIINPPTKARTRRYSIIGGERIDQFEFNPLAAIRQDLQHTVGLMPALKNGEIVDDADPTLTVYPDADTETTTVDGRVARGSVNQTFSAIIAGGGNGSNDTESVQNIPYLIASTTTDQFAAIYRGIYLFDTSTIPADATISSIVFSLYGVAKASGLGTTTLEVVSSSPASNTAIANGDFETIGGISYGSISYASFGTTDYNDISLSGGITKEGITKLGTRLGWDLNGSFDGSWSSGATTRFRAYLADQAGTSNDPKLVVVYTTTSRRIMVIS